MTNRDKEFDCLARCPLLPDNDSEPNARQRELAVCELAKYCLGQATGTLSAPSGTKMQVRACGSMRMLANWDREPVLVRRGDSVGYTDSISPGASEPSE